MPRDFQVEPPEPPPRALKVRLAFADERELMEGFGQHVTEAGLFVRSRDPRPLGTRLSFELSLRGGARVIAGEGVVRFVRPPGQGVAGMGLAFESLTPESRGLVERIVEARAKGTLPPAVEGARVVDWPAPGGSAPAIRPPALAIRLELGWSKWSASFSGGRVEVAAEVDGVRGIGRLCGALAGAKSVAAVERRELATVCAVDDGRAALVVGGEKRAGDELATTLFQSLHAELERAASTSSFALEIALPSATTSAARRALARAARTAGFEVTRFVASPIAAAGGAKRALVVAVDEGQLEAAVVEAGRLTATASDPDVGGAELELALTGSALALFEDETGVAVPEDRGLFARVREAMAKARDALDQDLEADVHVPALVTTGLAKAELVQRLTRARLHALASPIVERAAALAREALAQRRLGLGEVERVVVAGDAGGRPTFARLLSQRLGREVELASGAATTPSDAPAESVLGASVWAGLTTEALRRLVERGARLPAGRTTSVLQSQPGQTDVALQLFQGDRAPPQDNDFVALAVAGPIPPPKRGLAQVAFTVAVDTSGELSVTARETGSGAEVPVRFETRRG